MPIVGYYRWLLGPTSTHCQKCLDRASMVKTYAEWLIQGLPPLHPGCLCKVVFIGAVVTAEDQELPQHHEEP